MTDQPIACTLTPGARTERLAAIDALAADALVARERTADGLRVRLRATAETERRARDLIAAEAECCAFLTFSLDRAGDELVLSVAGPPEAGPVLDRFFATGAAPA